LELALRNVFTKGSSSSLPDEGAGGAGVSDSGLVGVSASEREDRGEANSSSSELTEDIHREAEARALPVASKALSQEPK